jgi:general secretion pathway protein H
MSRMPRCADRNGRNAVAGDAGFSLLELIVVLIILGAVLTISRPYFNAGLARSPRTGVQSMALQVAADLRATRAEALRSNTEQTFTLDLSNRTTWSMLRPKPRPFVNGLDVDVNGAGFDWSNNGVVQIRFQPTGVAAGGEIVVRDGRPSALKSADQASRVRIDIDWLTGVTRLERVR